MAVLESVRSRATVWREAPKLRSHRSPSPSQGEREESDRASYLAGSELCFVVGAAAYAAAAFACRSPHLGTHHSTTLDTNPTRTTSTVGPHWSVVCPPTSLSLLDCVCVLDCLVLSHRRNLLREREREKGPTTSNSSIQGRTWSLGDSHC